jgi:integrase
MAANNPRDTDKGSNDNANSDIVKSSDSGNDIDNNMTIGEWLFKFTALESNPKALKKDIEDKPYSLGTIRLYALYYRVIAKYPQFTCIKMNDITERDLLSFLGKLSKDKNRNGIEYKGTRAFHGIKCFLRMAFSEYEKKALSGALWNNPFKEIRMKKFNHKPFDALQENEVKRLLSINFKKPLEKAICHVMFYCGLRKGEIFSLKWGDLDFEREVIYVRRAFQSYVGRKRVLGPTKNKKERVVPFPPIVQNAVKEYKDSDSGSVKNIANDFIFTGKEGKALNSNWLRYSLTKGLKAAAIDTGGRKIAPHSCRSSLALILSNHNEPLINIQNLLDHSSLNITKKHYLPTKTDIGSISEKLAMFSMQ